MSRIRKILLSTLGEKQYLRLLAGSFQQLYKTGRLGVDYQDVYFLHHVVRKDDVCIDIGAHLGYFTFELSRITGQNGHVYAIEPVSKFNKTLKRLLEKRKVRNVTLEQYAMGADEPFVEMGIPQVNNVKKFAYARAVKTSTFLEYVETEKVPNISGDVHFGGLPRVDFIKCDVEGLEHSVFSSFKNVIDRHRPLILVELGDVADRQRMLDLLSPFGYRLYYLHKKELLPIAADSPVKPVSHNHYFVPDSRLSYLNIVL
jgi:FkbM family methyltransferase